MPKQPTKFTRPEHAKHAAHPFNSKTNHEKLLDLLKRKLATGRKFRDASIRRYMYIDRQVAGWVENTTEEKKIRQRRRNTGKQIPNKLNIPLTMIHADDMVTYFLQMFAPVTGVFTMNGDQAELAAGKGLIKLMDQHATHAGYFREFHKTLFAAVKYNLTGIHGFWDNEVGNVVGRGEDGRVVKEQRTVWSGNRIEALDMYNTFFDPNVNPIDVYKHGEFAGFAKRKSRFYVERMTLAGRFNNTEKYFEDANPAGDSPGRTSDARASYYISPPAYAKLNQSFNSGSDETDWGEFFGVDDAALEDNAVELVTLYLWINPLDYGLVPGNQTNKANRNSKEIWRFTIANGDTIIETLWMHNIHEHIPMYFGIPVEDEMGASQKSLAEVIDPFQTFMTFLFNTHIAATRKNIWGITIYDPTMVALDTMPEGEVAGIFPSLPAARGRDVRSYIYKDNQRVDTNGAINDAGAVMDFVQQIMPTQARPNQVASIDRAVKSQVATVRQGANRRTHKVARMLDSQLMRPMRQGLYYNILQFQKDSVDIGSQTITAQALGELDLETLIGQGLKSLDREATAEDTKEILYAIMQNQAAIQEFDVPGLVNALSNLMDIELDLNQFRKQQPQAGEANANDGGAGSTAPGTQGSGEGGA